MSHLSPQGVPGRMGLQGEAGITGYEVRFLLYKAIGAKWSSRLTSY